jgi:hypothetical protein
MMEGPGGVGGGAIPPSTPTSVGYPTNEGSVSGAPAQPGQMTDSKMSYPYPYPYPNPDVPVTDTREFLKTYYSASMRTRDVQGLTRRVETTVRGYGGRIDQESSSPQYGSVTFALPQSKYDAFRAELESLVGSRFISINISSQNLLPQKQSIEEQQKRADTTLSDYKAARQKIVNLHVSATESLQSKIDADTLRLTFLNAQPGTPQGLLEIKNLSDELAALKAQLASENALYAKRLNSADINIKSAQEWVKAVQTQDQTLLDNVATVTGTISIQWISLWECSRLYLPGYWIPFIFFVLAFLSFLNDRRRFKTV